MGRIKSKGLKSMTLSMMERHGDKFSADFGKNKAVVDGAADVSSKKLRNIMAGYASRLKKSGKY